MSYKCINDFLYIRLKLTKIGRINSPNTGYSIAKGVGLSLKQQKAREYFPPATQEQTHFRFISQFVHIHYTLLTTRRVVTHFTETFFPVSPLNPNIIAPMDENFDAFDNKLPELKLGIALSPAPFL